MATQPRKAHCVHPKVQWTVQILKISQAHSKMSSDANVNKEQTVTLNKFHFQQMGQRELDNVQFLWPFKSNHSSNFELAPQTANSLT